jgi:DNA-binding response OmpR family regulator
MRLLLVEDHEALRDLTRKYLHNRGFAVDAVGSGSEAAAAVSVADYDAVILDLGLPDIDGITLMGRLKAQRKDDVPMLIITARDALQDRVEGLNRGADDYIVKPFELTELEARLRSILRRSRAGLGCCYEAGNLTFSAPNQQAWVAGSPIELTRLESALLEELLRAAGRVIVKDSLEDRLYGFDEVVSKNALEALVSRLRKKLAAAGASVCVDTKRGIGYRLRAADEP